MRRQIVLGGLLVVGVLSMTAAALQQPPKPSASAIEVEKLADNLFVLKALAAGGGGNTSVLVTANGVTVIDTKNPGWGQPLLEKIKTLTPKPVTMIINTHTHGDHVSGNVEFPGTVFAPVELPDLASLPLYLTVQNSPVLFGCRSGLCGTCLIEVEAPYAELEPPDPDEAEALEIYAPGNTKARLACQLVLSTAVRIRKIESA